MFKLYKKWLEHHKAEGFKRGFGWAMSAYYVENLSLEYICMMSYPVFDDPERDFDKGALAAVRVIERINDAMGKSDSGKNIRGAI